MPNRSKPNPSSPGVLAASGGTAPAGGSTWSNVPPCSSNVISSSVSRHAGDVLTAFQMRCRKWSPAFTSCGGSWSVGSIRKLGSINEYCGNKPDAHASTNAEKRLKCGDSDLSHNCG